MNWEMWFREAHEEEKLPSLICAGVWLWCWADRRPMPHSAGSRLWEPTSPCLSFSYVVWIVSTPISGSS